MEIMLRFKPSPPYSHDAANLFHSPFPFLDVFLVDISHPSVGSPTDVRLSQKRRMVRISGLTGFFYESTYLWQGRGSCGGYI